MSDRPVIFWFRDDLRLADNPGLAAAAATGRPLVLLYLLDEVTPGVRAPGGAARWWLDKSLRALSAGIAARGGRLVFRRGAAATVIHELVAESGADAVFWNRRYGAARHADALLKASLDADGVNVSSYKANLLVEPFEFSPDRGRYPRGGYKVFTPFLKAVIGHYASPPDIPAPQTFAAAPAIASENLDSWGLHPSRPDWSAGIAAVWTPGEAAGHDCLKRFLENDLSGYAEARDRPDLDTTSRLSPYLRFGEIGPAQVWRAARAAEARGGSTRDIEKFIAEICWREFSWHLLYHDPDLYRLCWRRDYEEVAWRDPDPKDFSAWTQGRTGFPLVDAGMRQLWATGWMHNRVRMVTASFLTKDMLVHWRHGEAWFWDTLVDADEASNPCSWQWVAGTGADAAPYFRVFNPALQGERFDPAGTYVRHWVPELARAPARGLHQHSPALRPGAPHYPKPMLDHSAARDRVIAAFKAVNRPPQEAGLDA